MQVREYVNTSASCLRHDTVDMSQSCDPESLFDMQLTSIKKKDIYYK
jgi:hypothetical protein